MKQYSLRHITVGMATNFAITSLVALTSTVSFTQPSHAQSRNKFFCGKNKGVPTTMVRTSRGNEPMIRWKIRDFSRSGYTPQKRCQTVSQRIQRYYDNGEIYITSRSNFKGYPVLCISNSKGGSCSSENILVTLKPGTDTGKVLQQIIDFRQGAADKPIELSGSEFVTYVDGEFYLDVKGLVDSTEANGGGDSNSKPVQPRF